MKVFEVRKPRSPRIPILISFPHSGHAIPDNLKADFLSSATEFIDDTDWFLPELYDFASEMGITTIQANLSRWVIDLNRNPASKPLYNDGRLITGLCTTTNFLGDPIYVEGREPNQAEIDNRLDAYFWPYYRQIEALLEDMIAEFGCALLYDSHSIRSEVKTIQKDRFPDMVLGTADEKSADARLISITLNTLRNGPYQVEHNHPFKGGHITRYFGNPSENRHALQLERCKDLYMDEAEKGYDLEKAQIMRPVLKNMFKGLSEQLKSMGK